MKVCVARDLFRDRPQHARREEPTQSPWPGGRKRLDVDAAHRSLFQLDRFLRTDQARGELAQVGFVSDQRDAVAARVLRELVDDGSVCPARGERVDSDDIRMTRERGRNDVGSLFGTKERTGEHDIECDIEFHEAISRLSQTLDALGGQRTLRIVGILRAALSGDSMPDYVELMRAGHRAPGRRESVRRPRGRGAAVVR